MALWLVLAGLRGSPTGHTPGELPLSVCSSAVLVLRHYRVRPLSSVAGRTQATFSSDEGPREARRRQGWGFWKPSMLLRNRRQTPGRSDVQSSGVPATLARLGIGHHALVGLVPSGCLRVPRLNSAASMEVVSTATALRRGLKERASCLSSRFCKQPHSRGGTESASWASHSADF
jgi:hypothetical protein